LVLLTSSDKPGVVCRRSLRNAGAAAQNAES
jgi:hypothetical protein